MSREVYFSYLEGTTAIVGPMIGQLLAAYKEQGCGVYDDLMLFAGTRLNRPLQKPSLFRIAFEACGGTHWERFAPIAAASELLNISSYQANVSFDNKLGTLTRPQKDAQFICSMIARECAASTIRTCDALPARHLAALEESISRINSSIYLAQYYDLFVLARSRLSEYASDEGRYLADYRTRCHLGSGVFNGEICHWGGLLAEGDPDRVSALTAFGEAFGSALQIANDIGDYAPFDPNQPDHRDYQDRYSDYRNGRLTPILYFLLTRDRCYIPPVKEDNSPSCPQYDELASRCIASGALDYAQALAKDCIKSARRHLDGLPDSAAIALLKQMATIVSHNKFIRAFRKLEIGGSS